MNYTDIPESDRLVLLGLAEDTIAYGVEAGRYKPIDRKQYPQHLSELGASFVTLYSEGSLRGCIGNLRANRPLIEDVAHNAYASAFKDPRFEPLVWREFLHLQIEISVLSSLQAIEFENEENLLQQLRPGVDGIVLADGHYRATFLPKVWEHLPGKRAFLEQLKMKAGLRDDYWSDSMQVQRYTTSTFTTRETKQA